MYLLLTAPKRLRRMLRAQFVIPVPEKLKRISGRARQRGECPRPAPARSASPHGTAQLPVPPRTSPRTPTGRASSRRERPGTAPTVQVPSGVLWSGKELNLLSNYSPVSRMRMSGQGRAAWVCFSKEGLLHWLTQALSCYRDTCISSSPPCQ